MSQGLFIALAYLGSVAAGLAVTAFLWPPWYELAPVIPLIERLTHVALAVTSVTMTRRASWRLRWGSNCLPAYRS